MNTQQAHNSDKNYQIVSSEEVAKYFPPKLLAGTENIQGKPTLYLGKVFCNAGNIVAKKLPEMQARVLGNEWMTKEALIKKITHNIKIIETELDKETHAAAHRINGAYKQLITAGIQEMKEACAILKRAGEDSNILEALQTKLSSLEKTTSNIACGATINIATTVAVSAEEKVKIQNAINTFAHELHLKLSQKSTGSICFAPLSIVAALGMTLNAMTAADKQEFLKRLNLENLPESTFNAGLMQILNELAEATGDSCAIRFANAIAMGKKYAEGIDPAYKEVIAKEYNGELFKIEGCDQINKWVSDKTEGMIQKLLTPEQLGNDVVAVLLNAMYFSGKWETEFETAVNGTFTFANNATAEVKMMSVEKLLPLYQDNDFDMVEIPYKSPTGHSLKHIIFLPKDPKALSTLEKRMTPEFIKMCRENSRQRQLMLEMPKIDANLKNDTMLGDLLEMGLPLSVLLPALHPNGEISSIVHQAKLEVDEKGTKGAAATAVIVMESCYRPVELQSISVNHDYAYLIVDGDNILFQGNVKDSSVLIKS